MSGLINKRVIGNVIVKSYPNIALIKYFGKNDENKNLPSVPSLGVNIDKFYTETNLTVFKGKGTNSVTLNYKPLNRKGLLKLNKIIKIFRNLVSYDFHCQIESTTNFPTDVGLSSSSSGYSSITIALNEALNLNLKTEELSAISRIASGSSSRAFYDGFSYLLPNGEAGKLDNIPNELFEKIFMISVCLSNSPKKISTTYAMKKVKETSFLYNFWIKYSNQDFENAISALRENNLNKFADICERNFIMFYSLLKSTSKSIDYLSNNSKNLIRKFKKYQNRFNFFISANSGDTILIFAFEEDKNYFINLVKQITFEFRPSLINIHSIGKVKPEIISHHL